MTPKPPPTKPTAITAARLARIRKADPELVELLGNYVDTRLRNITSERVQLLKLAISRAEPDQWREA